ncbi:hypothetical protein QUF64_05215 [Anaerolineales bacterium HSG6]|nr:hypothetical protein [Anaerolineales bacterium HSG6]MDM8532937.1 hypothetical protein [Anaerolineales bacterium HSG25]
MQPEFVGLQLSILVRSDKSASKDVALFLESLEFQQAIQEKLHNIMEETLNEAKIQFDEVIISLDTSPQKAKSVEADKPSMLGRLLGR